MSLKDAINVIKRDLYCRDNERDICFKTNILCSEECCLFVGYEETREAYRAIVDYFERRDDIYGN